MVDKTASRVETGNAGWSAFFQPLILSQKWGVRIWPEYLKMLVRLKINNQETSGHAGIYRA